MRPVVMWFDNVGWQHVLMGEPGRKWIPVVRVAGGVTVTKVPVQKPPRFYDAKRKGKPYPESRAIRAMKRIGKDLGMTKGAAALLGGAA